MVPVRTCVGCRRRVDQGDVVRLVLAPEQVRTDDAEAVAGGPTAPEVVVDAARRLPGRGAWLHPERGCFETAMRRKAFHRAFRRPVSVARLDFETIEAAARGTMSLHTPDESGFREMDTR